MTREGKTVGKPHFRHQDEADTQPRIMIANHAARNSKRVGLARELGNMVAGGKGMLNNQMDEASKQQHNDIQGMAREGKTIGKPHFQLQDEADTQPRIMIANHAARNSKERVGLTKELGNMVASGKGMLNNQMDEASKQQHNDVQGMAREGKTIEKPHFRLQDEADTQPRIMIANHAARNSKERVGLAKELGKTVGKTHFRLQDGANTQPRIVIGNPIAGGKDCQNIQGMSNNQMDESSKQQNIDVQGLAFRSAFNNNSYVEFMVHDQNDLMDEESDQDSESEFHGAKKKTRGPTFMKEIWGRPSTLPRIKIQCDGMGRPIGSKRNKFIDFLGFLARNGKFCPIDVEDWHKMPVDNKTKMLKVIKEKYNLPPGTENWTLRSIAKKWRNWKSELKKHYDPELPMQVLLQQRDERAFVEQYVKLVAQWNSEKSKERSEKNKAARMQKIMHQTTGRRSFAQVQQKLRKEKGRPPSRVELFHACFTHANGIPSSSIVAEKLDAMKELANQLPEDSDDQIGHDDIFAQIIGPDRPGRVRMLGDGVSPSDLWGEVPSRSTCNRIVMEQKTKLEKMYEQVIKQGEHIAMLEAKISNQSNQNLGSNCNSGQHTSSSGNPLVSVPVRLSLRIGCSVSIKSLFDSTKIVAKGVVRSMDPITEVGRQTLGPNWCEIQVLVILEPEESLIRPYDLFQKFGDALGGMIAWPCHLLTVNEEDFY